MSKRLIIVAIFATLITAMFSVSFAQDTAVKNGPITQAVIDRGSLICGVHTGLAGFGKVNSAGEYEGFDVDFCRAVAAAILGDATKVTYVPLNADQRQAALQSGQIDMLSRNTTYTITRDSAWGATFGPTTFYDSQGLAVNSDSGITDIEGLEGATVCVQSGTTTELNLTDAFKSRNIAYTSQVFSDPDATWQAFVDGRCDAFTTDKSGIAAYRATADDPSKYTILDINLSKEPLGPASPQSDPQFADIIRWVVYGTFQAEEWGITSQNVDSFLTSDSPDIQRFLGTNDNHLGSTLYNLKDDFMVTVIKQVGNYGEIFDRNIGPDTVFALKRGLNALWTQGGLIYSPPFR